MIDTNFLLKNLLKVIFRPKATYFLKRVLLLSDPKPVFSRGNRHFRPKLKELVAIVFGLCLIVGCNDVQRKNRNQIEDLLGIQIPEDVVELQYEKVFVSSEFLKPYYAFVQMEISEEEYLDLVHQLGLTLQPRANRPVPVISQLGREMYSPDWWPPPFSPDDSFPGADEFLPAAGEFNAAQNEGSIISAYYDGVAYFRVFETGTP